ncbi:unnamed protein product [Ambrosiozyma monospora]|uniref:Unnamed protein product n=1 Tax=Ambrosiozyma monospora TaxID=43982 RepID=A0ACB5TM77_AMBMO|nr:unnamed protein product [Ambrosiozyma monospora]
MTYPRDVACSAKEFSRRAQPDFKFSQIRLKFASDEFKRRKSSWWAGYSANFELSNKLWTSCDPRPTLLPANSH